MVQLVPVTPEQLLSEKERQDYKVNDALLKIEPHKFSRYLAAQLCVDLKLGYV